LLALHSDAEGEAEGSFQHAMELAVHQEALSLELRAATSFARFLGRHGRPDEAKARLVPVVARINEGIEDADFKEASALLGELG
jgi:predicted ATPase